MKCISRKFWTPSETVSDKIYFFATSCMIYVHEMCTKRLHQRLDDGTYDLSPSSSLLFFCLQTSQRSRGCRPSERPFCWCRMKTGRSCRRCSPSCATSLPWWRRTRWRRWTWLFAWARRFSTSAYWRTRRCRQGDERAGAYIEKLSDQSVLLLPTWKEWINEAIYMIKSFKK